MFEFDPEKSKANLAKHGIDFIDAQALWQDDKRAEIAARSETEMRMAVIGMIEEQLWVAIVTARSGGIRIISVRRARAEERDLYGQQDN